MFVRALAIWRRSVVSGRPRIRAAERVVFPGVGAAGAAMKALRELGLADALYEVVQGDKPLLAICVGMQVLFGHCEEDGGVDGLGVLPGRVRRFTPSDPRDKVPHRGWNAVEQLVPHPLF